MSGDTERLVREFCTWWDAHGHDATSAEGERIARELLSEAGTSLTQDDVDAHCAKLKRGFAGGRTIIATSEVGEALVEWLADSGVAAAATPLDDAGPLGLPESGGPDDELGELSWGDEAGAGLLDDLSADDLPPIPADDDLPPLPTADDGPPLSAPDMSFEEPDVLSLDARVDAIGGRDVFAAADPPPGDFDLQLDVDADMIGQGDKAHYVREEEMEVGGRDPGLDVDVDPNAENAQTDRMLDLGAVDAGFDDDIDVPESLAAGVPQSRASAAPVGRATSSQPPRYEPPADEDTREDLPALTTPPPPARASRQPLVIGAVLVLLIAAAAVVTFAL